MSHEPAFPEFERELLRKGITARSADAARCHECRRTPLVGELIYRYDGGQVRCELCRSRRRETPIGTEVVHGSEFGHAVRISRRVAA